jgi:Flp pilus assembly protein TadD
LFLISSDARAQKEAADNLPMFGQPDIVRSENLKKADEEFIRNAVAKYGSRQTASNAVAAEGWTLVRAGKQDAALQRFNQAWLLNPKNFQAFWGFGAVLSERGKIAEAIDQLETARELAGDQPQRVALLSDLGTLHSEYAVKMPPDKSLDRARQFVLANSRFTESLEIDPNFAPSWREWAISLYEQARYAEAWAKARRAKELNAEPFPPGFLQKLTEKMPEPR